MSDGTLLIGAPTDPDIMYWRKVTGQDRLSALISFRLHHHENLSLQLWRLADQAGLVSHGTRTTDAALGRMIKDAIDRKRLAAVFLPNVPPPAPMKIVLTQVQPFPKAEGGKFDFARATRAERMVEMLRRTPPHLRGQVKQIINDMLSSGSVAILGATLAVVAAAHLVGIGEEIDVALAAFAFITAGWEGLNALKDVIVATVKVAQATRDGQLDEAARQFSSGIMVLGEAFLAAVLARGSRRGERTPSAVENKLPIQRRAEAIERIPEEKRIQNSDLVNGKKRTATGEDRDIKAVVAKVSKPVLISRAQAKAILMKHGFSEARAQSYIESFNGPITVRNIEPGEEFLRYYDPPNKIGSFVGKTSFSNSNEAVNKLALEKFHNTASHVQRVVSSKSTIVLEGAIKGGAVDQTVIIDLEAFIFEEGRPY